MPAPITPARRSLLAVLGGVIAFTALVAWIASLGGPHDAKAGLISVLYVLVQSGPPALAYLLGAIGVGTLFARVTAGARDPFALQCGLGLALMLTLSHGLGVLGLLSGSMGLVLGGGVVLVGILLLARQVMRHVSKSGGVVTGSLPWQVLAGLPALAVILVAACSPPGWLWDSEARGYDVLEYHLRLPQEWIAAGRIWPRDWNVYSYLPGYVESAFVHLGALLAAPKDAGPSHAMGLLAGEGTGVISCQFLVAGMGIMAAVLVGRMVARSTSGSIEALAGVLFLSIPWVMVTGSMAYNEMGMLGLFAAAVIAAGDLGLSAARRGLLAGFLVGVACGCKPTALFLCAPVVGAELIGTGISRRGAEDAEKKKPPTQMNRDAGEKPEGASVWTRVGHLWLPLFAAAGAGLVAILPWLIRNWLACGNPVFPMATRIFGMGRWSAEQVDRYIAGHAFSGSVGARAAMLIDTGTPTELPRGLLHPQWAMFPAVMVIAGLVAVTRKKTRTAALILWAGLMLQLLAWMFFTHLQSRFLLPIAVTGCGMFGLGLFAVMPGRDPASAPAFSAGAMVNGIGALICIALAGMGVGIFKAQAGELPNLLLLESPWFRTGELDRAALKLATPDQQKDTIERMAPEAFLNVVVPPGTTVYLLGSATPLYYSCPLVYNTAWDTWPIGEAMRKAPGKPAEWARELWSRGVRLVLLDEPEIERLTGSGWIDPTVTVDGVRGWLKDEGRLVRSWRRVELWQLKEPGK